MSATIVTRSRFRRWFYPVHWAMVGVRDRLIRVCRFLLTPLRAVRRGVGLALALSGLDSDDLEATTAVLVYLTLATAIVIWASSMYLLVRAITGV